MAEVTVSQFAEALKVPIDRLLAQLDEAGIKVKGADDLISDEAKMELLTHLRRAHGRQEEVAAPRKITLRCCHVIAEPVSTGVHEIFQRAPRHTPRLVT